MKMGRYQTGRYLSIKWLPQTERKASRWQVIVPSKITNNMVERNRFKRRLRAITQAADIPSTIDCLVIAKKESTTHSFEAVLQDLNNLLKNLHRYG